MPSLYKTCYENGEFVDEHVLVARAALGRKLPKGAEVHHVDLNGRNNSNSNLVICQNHEYHILLHRRTRAYNAVGNASYLKCHICKQWDVPKNIVIYGGRKFVHQECSRRRALERVYAEKRQAQEA